jgi:NAD(P)H-hydrate repair Nnr-like enzyme with NAD(P)H-hydrate dehydratase domain
MHPSIEPWLKKITHPGSASRKGQNGKAIVIGGSDLFHAASQWSFKAASRWVDMLFYSSIDENNELIRQAKLAMTDGVVVSRTELPHYLQEVQAALIGPGMRRDIASRFDESQLDTLALSDLTPADWASDTRAITSSVLRAFPQKRWVIDAGSLQILKQSWLPQSAVLTPHAGEFSSLLDRWCPAEKEQILSTVHQLSQSIQTNQTSALAQVMVAADSPEKQILTELSARWSNAIVLVKGPVDVVFDASQVVLVSGGNAGLTKGGTGDALAGLILGFITTSPVFESAVSATVLIKQAAHDLYLTRSEMFNTTDVVEQLPRTFAQTSVLPRESGGDE